MFRMHADSFVPQARVFVAISSRPVGATARRTARFPSVRTVCVCLFTTLGILSTAPVSGSSDTQRIKLENGATVLIRPVPDVDQVAVIALYSTGFADEPPGMTQAAHLAEHLRCFGGEAGSFERLNTFGMANAETLPTVTYYDFTGPADRLAEVLRIEASRMMQVSPTRELILQEASRCYQETDAVERFAANGMLKHAFMVFYQAWNHGREEGRVRGGLEDFSPDSMRAYILAHHAPQRLTLVIVGGVDAVSAKMLAQEHIGRVAYDGNTPRPTTWDRIARQQNIRWDARPRGVCIAYEPPADAEAHVVLTLTGAIVWNALGRDPQLAAISDSIACSSPTWPVGRLPFFAYATAKDGAESQKLRETLQSRLDVAIDAPGAALPQQIRMLAAQLTIQQPINQMMIEQTAKHLPPHMQNTPSGATRMVLGNAALQMALRDAWLGEPALAVIARVSAMSNEEILRVIRNAVEPQRRFVTCLEPKAPR